MKAGIATLVQNIHENDMSKLKKNKSIGLSYFIMDSVAQLKNYKLRSVDYIT